MKTNHIALIVAGGSGSRMGTNVAKQFLPFSKNTVLMHTIERFFEYNNSIKIYLVLPKSQISFWKELCQKYIFSIPLTLVEGGASRFQSVRNGIDSIKENTGFVAIHDGVRPLISIKTIKDSFEKAQELGNAVVAIKPKDSLRVFSENNQTKSVDRNDFFIIQTPQTFELLALKNAYKTLELPFFTDDASVFDYHNQMIHLIEGKYDNIKITTPEDLILAKALLKMQKNN